MSTFWIVLITVILTVGAQTVIRILTEVLKNITMQALSELCTRALMQPCFTVALTKGEEIYFITQLSNSKKCIVFTRDVLRQMPKGGLENKIEYVQNLSCSNDWNIPGIYD